MRLSGECYTYLHWSLVSPGQHLGSRTGHRLAACLVQSLARTRVKSQVDCNDGGCWGRGWLVLGVTLGVGWHYSPQLLQAWRYEGCEVQLLWTNGARWLVMVRGLGVVTTRCTCCTLSSESAAHYCPLTEFSEVNITECEYDLTMDPWWSANAVQ